MQTRRQIQGILSAAGVHPNKKLGQHFLIDLNLMRFLVRVADIRPDDIVLEVGCGTGSLTEALAKRAAAVVAVEIDGTLADIAGRHLREKQNIIIVNEDILEGKNRLNPAVLRAIANASAGCSGRLMLVGNLPYNAASPVMLNFVGGDVVAEQMHVTVQKEVAQRMAAKSASEHYGTLSIYLQSCGTVKIRKILRPSVFWPEPEVESAMVSFFRENDKAGKISDFGLFSQVVSLFLGHRRKTIRACTKLASGKLSQIRDWYNLLEINGIDWQKRPEQLSPGEYVRLANACLQIIEGNYEEPT